MLERHCTLGTKSSLVFIFLSLALNGAPIKHVRIHSTTFYNMGSEIDRSQQERVLIIAGVSTGLSGKPVTENSIYHTKIARIALVITLRFISRFYLTKWPGVDDWLMLGGFVRFTSHRNIQG